jgi:hypothetical protein
LLDARGLAKRLRIVARRQFDFVVVRYSCLR